MHLSSLHGGLKELVLEQNRLQLSLLLLQCLLLPIIVKHLQLDCLIKLNHLEHGVDSIVDFDHLSLQLHESPLILAYAARRSQTIVGSAPLEAKDFVVELGGRQGKDTLEGEL